MGIEIDKDMKIKVGIIGCGNISDAYLSRCVTMEIIEVAACADIDMDRAREKAKKYNLRRACTAEQLLADKQIRIVLNLTPPKAHADISAAILNAGKNLYSEKPLATDRVQAEKLLKIAKQKQLLIGCAPDTFMGAGLQTARKVIDEGTIGTPLAVSAFMLSAGPEKWHPDPEFFFQYGAGPMFDMGPYYLTAMINLLGPVKSVTASTAITRQYRTILSRPFQGRKIKVEVPTHVAAILNFHCGVIATLVTSFDVIAHTMPNLEIYGTKGSLLVANPNSFAGPVKILLEDQTQWNEVLITHAYDKPSRGLGPADMAYALLFGRAHRASAEIAFHVLDIMQTIHEAAQGEKIIYVKSSCQRPAPLPPNLPDGLLDM
ncbi:MAG: Gfo/Idh/MocA family oxidoreductase [Planctomycetota bacterium]